MNQLCRRLVPPFPFHRSLLYQPPNYIQEVVKGSGGNTYFVHRRYICAVPYVELVAVLMKEGGPRDQRGPFVARLEILSASNSENEKGGLVRDRLGKVLIVSPGLHVGKYRLKLLPVRLRDVMRLSCEGYNFFVESNQRRVVHVVNDPPRQGVLGQMTRI